MTVAEFHRPIDVGRSGGRVIELDAGEAERAALARRFGLIGIEELRATLTLDRENAIVSARGNLAATIVQSCAISGEDFKKIIAEPLAFRFVPSGPEPNEEIVIEPEGSDEIEYAGTTLDLGEAVAQSLALAINPFAAGPNADDARRKAGLSSPEANNPFAVIASMHKRG